MLQITRSHGIAAHAITISPKLRTVLQRWGLALNAPDADCAAPGFCSWARLDDALEHCETQLLASLMPDDTDIDMPRLLLDLGRQNPRTADLIARMQQRHLQLQEPLITADDPSHDVFFVVSGSLGVHLPGRSGGSTRVRSIGQGAIVGEIAYLTGQPNNADVICEQAAFVLCLGEAAISDIERTDPDLTALMMGIFGRSLAVKPAQSNSRLANLQTD